jgi:predicted nucleic acid-binding Zn ribbon protein
MTPSSSQWRHHRKRIGDFDNQAATRLLGESVETLLKNHQLGSTNELVEVINLWPSLVGDRMSGHATPIKIEADELIVAVDHPAWATELRLMNSKVTKQLKEKLETTSINRLKVHIQVVSDLD